MTNLQKATEYLRMVRFPIEQRAVRAFAAYLDVTLEGPIVKRCEHGNEHGCLACYKPDTSEKPVCGMMISPTKECQKPQPCDDHDETPTPKPPVVEELVFSEDREWNDTGENTRIVKSIWDKLNETIKVLNSLVSKVQKITK